MNREQSIGLGLEIVAAMKASCYGCSIEDGREMVLEDTEVDRLEGFSKECWDQADFEQKEKLKNICKVQRERLDNQALFVAQITLAYLNEKGFKIH